MLLDPTFLEIKAKMEEFKNKVSKQSRSNPTNVFIGYSGHGTSIRGELFMTLPTKLTQEEYIAKFEDISIPVDNLPIVASDLKRFRELRKKIDRNFLVKTFEISKKVNEND